MASLSQASAFFNPTVTKRPGIVLYGVPYSEHSSFRELRQCVAFMRPGRIVPTVNNSNNQKVQAMLSLLKPS
jgi:DNA cross-link repair 1A protein